MMLAVNLKSRLVTFFFLILPAYLFGSNYSELYPDLESYRLNLFPNDKIALHMSCVESNMFATNCACHIRCQDPLCKQAWEICEKYKTR